MRIDGYAPIREYAAIGDGRTVALVASDGSIDWLALPTVDSAAIFAAVLDAGKGGRFEVRPEGRFDVERRYVPGTNVLETTFVTDDGTVCLTDAITLQDGGMLPWFELVRRVEGLSGRVSMRWQIEPRLPFGTPPDEIRSSNGVPVIKAGDMSTEVLSFGAGEPQYSPWSVQGRFDAEQGQTSTLALIATQDEPLPLPPREEIETRIDGTIDTWRRWLSGHNYEGPWKDAVERSALAMKLLIHAPTGAIVAAPTTSLPERIGGDRNYDYRYIWTRDSSFAMDALMRLGFREQAHHALSFLLSAVRRTHPRVQAVYDLRGHMPNEETTLDLAGYRGSRPVNLGNAAAGQTQLGNYGDLFETLWWYINDGGLLDRTSADAITRIADYVGEVWENTDSGIWELPDRKQYTISKIACWVALDRAVRLAESGHLASEHVVRWRKERDAVADFIRTRCWSEHRKSYTFFAGDQALDASVLTMARNRFADPEDPRLHSTIDAVRCDLADGPTVYRYTGARDKEGAFIACSFWLVEALAYSDRSDEAADVMDALIDRANDVGLYSEQIDPSTNEFLGNFPQALSHLALVNAASMASQHMR